MNRSQSTTTMNRPLGTLHRTKEPLSKDKICNRAGIRMHDTASSTAAAPIRVHF